MRHVALLIETSRSHGRAMIRGVRRYVAEHEPWSLYLELRALDSPPPAWLRRWQGDGILGLGGRATRARRGPWNAGSSIRARPSTARKR